MHVCGYVSWLPYTYRLTPAPARGTHRDRYCRALFDERKVPSRFLTCINFVENIKQPVLSFGCKAASSRSTLTDWLCIRLSSRSLSPDLARSVAVEVSHIPRKSGVPRLALCPVPPVQCALASYLDVSGLFAIVLVAILQCSNPLFSLRPFDGNGPALSRSAPVVTSRPI